jgi:pimeloyl-ACP methyl ester carboxylesterase
VPPRSFQPPVIVLPGITGTTLHDDYPLASEAVWTLVLSRETERVSLHPDDPRYEAREPARIRPGRLLGTVYDDLVLALRHDLSPRDDRRTPVFPFPYDWRQPIEVIADQLAEFAAEVIDRTTLLRHYSGYREVSGGPRVDLVGHSMGGLVIADYLARHGAERVRKVVTLGTPYEGSLEAVVKLVTGLGTLSERPAADREREAARSTPAIYYLLPSFAGAVRRAKPGVATDLFRVDAWQASVLESLAEYVRLHGVVAGDRQLRRVRARELLGTFLRAARQHRGRVRRLDLGALHVASRDWLAIVGVDAETRVAIVSEERRGRVRFVLEEDQVRNEYPDSRATGDGTVPLAGAVPRFLPEAALVALRPGDFGRFEWRDRGLLQVAGFHAALPNLNVAQRLVLRHLRPAFAGEVWARPIPGVARRAWRPPIPRLASRP